MPRFENQTALVVGGAHGIGRAIAARLAQEGAAVTIADADLAAAEATASEILAHAIACDVRHAHQVRLLARQFLSAHGHLDILMYVRRHCAFRAFPRSR